MAAMASPEAAAAAVCSPGAPGAADRVAVAYDGSDHASFAAKWAAEHLLRPGSKLVLVAVASGAPVSALAPTSIVSATVGPEPPPAHLVPRPLTLPCSPASQSGLDAYVANIKIKDDDKVEALVRMAKELVSTGCVPSDDVQAVIIPTAGNASSGGDDVRKPRPPKGRRGGGGAICRGRL